VRWYLGRPPGRPRRRHRSDRGAGACRRRRSGERASRRRRRGFGGSRQRGSRASRQAPGVGIVDLQIVGVIVDTRRIGEQDGRAESDDCTPGPPRSSPSPTRHETAVTSSGIAVSPRSVEASGSPRSGSTRSYRTVGTVPRSRTWCRSPSSDAIAGWSAYSDRHSTPVGSPSESSPTRSGGTDSTERRSTDAIARSVRRRPPPAARYRSIPSAASARDRSRRSGQRDATRARRTGEAGRFGICGHRHLGQDTTRPGTGGTTLRTLPWMIPRTHPDRCGEIVERDSLDRDPVARGQPVGRGAAPRRSPRR